MKKENIEVVAIKGDFEGEMVNVTLQVSKNGDKSETIIRQFVITDETNSEELVEQCLKERYGDHINIIQKSIMVESIKIQLDTRIKEIQQLEGISTDDVIDDINSCEENIDGAIEKIQNLFDEYCINDVDVHDLILCGMEDMDLDDTDMEESDKSEIEDLLEQIDIITADKQEFEKKKNILEKFGEKVTFGHLYSENFTSRSSEIVDTIITKVPFAALAMYFLGHRKSDDFLQHDHSFVQYMVPIDVELGGFDGKNFNFEFIEECEQALKDLIYDLYMAIPGES